MATIAISLLVIGILGGLFVVRQLSQGDPEPRERRIPPEYDQSDPG